MTRPLHIWVLGDGKPGHMNQSLGLAEAIGKRRAVMLHRIDLGQAGGFIARIRHAIKIASTLPKPDLLIGAGHKTHAALLWLTRQYGGASIVLMKPSLPAAWFDLCLVPEHDLTGKVPRSNMLATIGALNRVSAPEPVTKQGGLILLGGPSGSHAWDADEMRAALEAVVMNSTIQSWSLTDSRRTPDGMLDELRGVLPKVEMFPHQQTPPDWLPQHLAQAEEVWVSADSVSMIYEALSSGARVGLLPVPLRKRPTRVSRGVDKLIADGWVTDFSTWSGGRLTAPPRVLREADRCADWLLEKLSLRE